MPAPALVGIAGTDHGIHRRDLDAAEGVDHLVIPDAQGDVPGGGGGGAVEVDGGPHGNVFSAGGHPPELPGSLGRAG